MRLLKRSDDGNLSLTEDLIGDKEVPTYAILSHTWQDGQEVTFDDWTKGNAKSKVGYEKIRFCAQQAERDGLYHFWVDTCCINKADPVELQDAINSMFRWYKGAAKCYVYLSDVSTTKQKAGSESPELTWEPTFRASRWFTRGWTLQELVAPLSVDFFSQEGEHLGDKQSLEQLIQEITGIPISALRGAALQGFSVDKRLKWAKNRQTTRKEDKAYCLMGLFGIFLPLIYGEGEDHAFKRLQDEIYKATNSLSQRQHSGLMSKEDQECVKSLRLTDPSHDKSRIEETKGGLLKDTYRWVLHHNDFQEWRDSEHGQLLWIKGDPGKGKTMLLCGIIDELRKSMAKTNLLSYFFCQATDSSINNSTAVLRGLLYMLVSQQPLLVSYVRDKYDHAGGALFNDANTWAALTEIFTNMLQDPSLDNAYLIIDALDECTTDLSKLLNFVAKQSSASSRVKWLVSSRNWPDIEEQLERAGHKVRLSLELNAKSVSTAVTIFIKQKVLRLAQRKRYDKQTQDAIQEHLRSNANNTFLWVALVCQNLEASSKRNVLKKLDMFPPGLDSLYERMMQQINKLEDDAELCKQVLALITLVYRPITLQELAVLVKDIGDDLESLQEIVGLCGSFLTLREETVYFVHQSAKDFLLIQAAKDVFPSGKEGVHHIIFARSLDFMSRTLQRDMYGLNALGCLIEAVKPQNPDPLAALAYSCIYWIDHLCDSKMSSSASKSLQDGGIVDVFLKEKFLYWLEGLSLCKSMPKGIVSMTNLWLLVQKTGETTAITQLVNDARRFIMYHKDAIESSPLQAYASALLFSPTRSLIRTLFQHKEPQWISIKPAIGNSWSACLQTLEGHTNAVLGVAFSPDGKQMASASQDMTVRIWDADSGALLQTLKGHLKMVTAVAFSPDGKRIASASQDMTVRIWDADTDSGTSLQTLMGHSTTVTAVAFSPNSKQLTSASYDKTVRIWDADSGVLLYTLEGHYDKVTAVAFSPDGKQLVSASFDKIVRTWDAYSGAPLHTLEGHHDKVTAVAFSPDGNQLVSCSFDKTVRIWDAGSGAPLQTLNGHSTTVTDVAFSPNSKQLASASSDKTVRIWDAGSGAPLRTLEGHSNSVTAVAFSLDGKQLASASRDITVKIWDAGLGAPLQMPEGHSDAVIVVAFSSDGKQLASSSYDMTVRIWDAGSARLLQTLKGHSNMVFAVAFSSSGTKLASASYDTTVRIWDTGSGAPLQTLEGHTDSVTAVAFSPDNKQLASGSFDMTIRIWDVGSGARQTLKGHSHQITAVAFSPDGKQLASASYDSTVRIWDAGSGVSLKTLEVGHIVRTLSFSDDNTSLQTDVGSILVSNFFSNDVATLSAQPPPSIYIMGQWVFRHAERILWLPPELRPYIFRTHGNIVCLGAASGKVIFIKFSS